MYRIYIYTGDQSNGKIVKPVMLGFTFIQCTIIHPKVMMVHTVKVLRTIPMSCTSRTSFHPYLVIKYIDFGPRLDFFDRNASF